MKEEKTNIPAYNYPEDEEFSFGQLIRDRKEDLKYVLSHRKGLAAVLIAGAILGALFAWWKPVTYSARMTFVVEDSKSSGGGLISALAGQFGFDLGSMTASSGVLSGDNVQELLRSQKMIKQTLLTPVEENGTSTLADLYAESNGLKKKWQKHQTDGKPVSFPVPAEGSSYSRLNDSLLHVMIKQLTEDELGVAKTDKKLSFFELNVTARNEQFAKLFSERLLEKASDFYIDTKTGRMRTNIDRLQKRADSISRVLNRKTYSASEANRVLLDLNPAYPTANVGAEVGERDKIVLATIYSEVVKNLEVSKTMLIQETPTFQVVDEPEYPLKKNKVKYPVAIVISMILAGLIFSLYLLVTRK